MSRFSAQEKLQIIQEFKRKKLTQKQICEKYGISRISLYQWLKAYRQTGNLEAKFKKGDSHYRYTNHKITEPVLEAIAQNPNLSLSDITRQVRKNRLKVGPHAIQNFLKRQR